MLFKIVEFPVADDAGNRFFIELGEQLVYTVLGIKIKTVKWSKFSQNTNGYPSGFKTMHEANEVLKAIFNAQPKEYLFDQHLQPL